MTFRKLLRYFHRNGSVVLWSLGKATKEFESVRVQSARELANSKEKRWQTWWAFEVSRIAWQHSSLSSSDTESHLNFWRRLILGKKFNFVLILSTVPFRPQWCNRWSPLKQYVRWQGNLLLKNLQLRWSFNLWQCKAILSIMRRYSFCELQKFHFCSSGIKLFPATRCSMWPTSC